MNIDIELIRHDGRLWISLEDMLYTVYNTIQEPELDDEFTDMEIFYAKLQILKDNGLKYLREKS